MRYRDFKIVETQVRESGEVYVIGDSHARAMGGANNLAVDGASLSAIARQASQVPDGATVYMTGGHNDVAAGTSPQAIASSVSGIVNGLTERGCTVNYILFPEGSGTANQENMAPTRQAIQSAVSVAQDLDGCVMNSDGIHCSLGAYRGIVSSGAVTRSDRQDNEGEDSADGLTAGPPYPPEDMDDVREMQTKLEELGYSVGNTGIDGKYGPRTTRAVRAFKTDFDISTPANTMTTSELATLAASEPVEEPTPTGNERQGSGSGRSFDPEELDALDFGGADNDRARQIAEDFLGRDMTDDEWDMLVRATVAEASPNQQERAAVMGVILNRTRTNYNGYGRGIEDQLYATAQFQAVTGTRTGPIDPETGRRTWTGPSRHFSSPTRQQVAGVVQAVIDHLADANRGWMNFTSNDPGAYGAGTNPEFRGQVARSRGSQVIGGTVFGTV